MRIIKMSNAFCDYEEIVEGFSTQTTKAEMKESLQEMAKNKELETWEFCLLYKIATGRINGTK